MKTSAPLLITALCGTVAATAQSFGPLSNAGDSTGSPVTVSVPTDPFAIAVIATFGISGSLTPSLGTPAGPTTYTIVFNTVTLSVKATDPVMSPNPAIFAYGPVSFTVPVNVIAGGSPITIAPQTISLPTQWFSVDSNLDLIDGPYATPYNEKFTVTLAARSAPIEGGGKGVDFSITPAINGALVPEPSTYALLAGLGLIGFAGWRRYNRTTEVA